MDILNSTVLGFTVVDIFFICLGLTVLAFVIAVILRIWIKYTMKTFVASVSEINIKAETNYLMSILTWLVMTQVLESLIFQGFHVEVLSYCLLVNEHFLSEKISVLKK